MSFADRMNIGRTTKRHLANIVIVCSLFAILYWQSGDVPDPAYTRRNKIDPGLKFGGKRDFSQPLGWSVTSPPFVDHTPGESNSLGVFQFFQDLWPSDEQRQRRRPEQQQQQQQSLKAFSLRVTNKQINSFHVTLPPLLPNYKNPCWMEELPANFSYDRSYYSQCVISRRRHVSKHAHKFRAFEVYLQNRSQSGQRWRIRCFPYFFLLGVGKCGTTDFFDSMKNFVSDFVPGFLKELHFWEWKRCHEREMCRSIDPRHPVFSDYLDTYDAAAEVIRRTVIKRRDGTSYHPLITGDFTPSTLTFHPCWERLPGNEHLHEPRVYSNFRMHGHLNKGSLVDPETFHNDVSKVLRDLDKCFRENTHRACVYKNMNFHIHTYVTNSLYEIFIRDWLLLFPRDQFLIMRMEDYSRDRVKYLRKTTEFLNITPLTSEQQWRIANKEITNFAGNKRDMLEKTRLLLRKFFKPWNQRLAKLLNDDRYTWNY